MFVSAGQFAKAVVRRGEKYRIQEFGAQMPNSPNSQRSDGMTQEQTMAVPHNVYIYEKKGELLAMFLLTFTVFIAEVTVGFWANSLALIASSLHMLSDANALITAYISLQMTPRERRSSLHVPYTFGWVRFEVLGALLNSVFIFGIATSLFIESFKRFLHPEVTTTVFLVLVVSSIGLPVDFIRLCMFRQHGISGHSGYYESVRRQIRLTRVIPFESPNEGNILSKPEVLGNELNTQIKDAKWKALNENYTKVSFCGLLCHFLTDILGSLLVMSNALIHMFVEFRWMLFVDPVISCLIIILTLASLWPTLEESALILLQTVPTHIQMEKLKVRLMENVEEILEVSDIQLWQLAGDSIIACENVEDYTRLGEKVKKFFHNSGIYTSIIEPEFIDVVSRDTLRMRREIDMIKEQHQTDEEAEEFNNESNFIGNIISSSSETLSCSSGNSTFTMQEENCKINKLHCEMERARRKGTLKIRTLHSKPHGFSLGGEEEENYNKREKDDCECLEVRVLEHVESSCV